MSYGQRKPDSKSFSAPLVLFCTLCVAALSVALAQAQDWKQVSSTGPSARYAHAMAYDSARGVTVLFGGRGSYYLGDTWEWDGSSWTQVSSTGPSASPHHAMAYDSARGVTVLFGGWDGSSLLGDTWEWDGSSWAQVSSSGPSARYKHAMAYDSARGVAVLFGGSDGTYKDDTWEWDGNSWTQASSTGPSARFAHAMAYDSARGVTVLFGGWDGSYLGDTWEWDGSDWTSVSTTGPSARRFTAMAYDSARGVTVLFGGIDGSGYLGDTWEYSRPAFDLKAIFRRASPRAVMINGRLKLIARAKNISEGSSIPTTVYFYLSTDRTLDESDILLGGKDIPALAPGKNKKVKMKFTVPAIVNPGFYYVIVEVEAEDAKPRNNVRASKYTIQVY